MGYVVRMPQMGMSMDQGTVVEWGVEEGEEVEAGDTVVVVESEKAEADVEARETGVLRRVLVEPGDVVEPGTPVGIVAGAEEDLSTLEAEAASDAPDHAEPTTEGVAPADGQEAGAPPSDADDVRATPGARQAADDAGIDLSMVEGTGPGGVITEADVRSAGEPAPGGTGTADPGDVRATPGARELADKRGIDLASIDGTGPGGAITEDDVEAVAESPDAARTSAGPTGLTVRDRRSLSGTQATISERLSASYREAVHVTLDREVPAGAMDAVLADAEGTADLAYTDLILAAVGRALVEHPAFNAHFEDETHVIYEAVNVGLAVDTGDALLTPVIRDVDEKDLVALEAARTSLTERVLAGEYTMDDLREGTFTVSNLGMFGVDAFTPIIDPPQVAILGVGRVRNGTMTLSLSFDHRVVNGAEAARFLGTIAESLADEAALREWLP